jgi:hypothetical protein
MSESTLALTLALSPKERRWRPCPSLLGSLSCERRGGWFAVKAAERFTFSSGEKAGMRADVNTI